MKDFIPSSSEQAELIAKSIEGRVVEKMLLYDEHGEYYLEIVFKDGSTFKIRYDWIYEWEFILPFKDKS
jgi:hypothetical protein